MYTKANQNDVELLKAMGSSDARLREAAQRAFAQQLTVPLRKGIFDADNLGSIYAQNVLAPGATANYPLDFVRPGEEDSFAAYTLPEQGRLPERRVEGSEVNVNTFKIGNSIDWDITYMKEGRFDVVKRALQVYEAGFTRKLNSDGWRTILAAASDRGLVVQASGTAVFTGAVGCETPEPGLLTKELISRMITAMTRGAGGNGNAGKLTDLYLSLEGVEHIRCWDANQLDEFSRREIYVSSDMGQAKIYGTLLHFMTEFGVGQEYQSFLTSIMGQSLPTNTQQFCIGLDLSTEDSFVMPIKEELESFDDPALYRQQRMGIFGWMRLGFAVLDNRRVLLGAF